MRFIPMTAVRVLLAALAVYLVVMGISYVAYPPRDEVLDTFEKSYIYGRNAGLVVRGRELFHRPGPQVFIVGASNGMVGFRPELLMRELPGVSVHNLAVGASNVTQALQTTELVLDALDREQRKNAVFVLGIMYPLFVENRMRWKGGSTTMEDEMLRYGLYRRSGGRVVPGGDEAALERKVFLLRPYLVMDAWWNRWVLAPLIDAGVYVYNRWGRRTAILNARDQDSVVVDESYKTYRLKFWKDYMGTEEGVVAEEQFAELERLADLVLRSGASLVLIDTPIPAWHMERAPHFGSYQKAKQARLDKLKERPGIFYADMQDKCEDFDFYDSVHPKPKTRAVWSHFLAERIKEFLAGEKEGRQSADQ